MIAPVGLELNPTLPENSRMEQEARCTGAAQATMQPDADDCDGLQACADDPTLQALIVAWPRASAKERRIVAAALGVDLPSG